MRDCIATGAVLRVCQVKGVKPGSGARLRSTFLIANVGGRKSLRSCQIQVFKLLGSVVNGGFTGIARNGEQNYSPWVDKATTVSIWSLAPLFNTLMVKFTVMFACVSTGCPFCK